MRGERRRPQDRRRKQGIVKFNIKVEVDGKERAVVAGPADVIALERRRNAGLQTIGGDMRLEDLAFLAWHRLRKTDPDTTAADFDAWVDSLDGLAEGSGEGEAAPPPA